MYCPPAFREEDRQALFALIEAHPLGTLVRQTAEGLEADSLPFWLPPRPSPAAPSEPLGCLRAHIARANPLWQEPNITDQTVLVIFRGADAYLSPNSYPSKQDHHRAVPTWNYRVVHAYGRLTFHHDEAFLRPLLAQLTRQHEASQAQPWSMSDAPKDFLQQMLAGLVGLELTLTRLEGKSKLSQNRTAADVRGAAAALLQQNQPSAAAQVAEAMLARLPPQD